LWESLLSGQTDRNASIISMMDEAENHIQDIENNYSRISKLEFGLVSIDVDTPVLLTGGKTYNILIVGERNKIKSFKLGISYKPGNEYIKLNEFIGNANIIKATFTPQKSVFYYFLITVNQFYSGFSTGGYFMIVSFN
jgi:hypothetical protein